MADKVDIAPELFKRMRSDMAEEIKKDPAFAEMLRQLDEGSADYETANRFAQSVADKMAEAMLKNLDSEELPNGTLYFNIAERTVRPMLEHGSGMVRGFCERVQESLNRQANLHIQSDKADSEEDRIKGLIDKLTDGEYDNPKKRLLRSATGNLMRHVVDSSVQNNAEHQYDAGLSPIIRRTTDGNCCEWCSMLAGTWDVGKAPVDIYKRHTDCGCLVTYDPGDGKRVNVHTHRLRADEEREERIAKAKELAEKQKDEAERARSERIARASGEAEQTRRIPGDNEFTIISPVIETKEFADKVYSLGVDRRTAGKILFEARKSLYHRSGTIYEDLTYISLVTGVAESERHFQDLEHVNATPKMLKMLENAPPRTIIGIHNHPNSTFPSGEDIDRARLYAFGVAFCHDGTIYKYTVSDDADLAEANFLLGVFQKNKEEGESLTPKDLDDLRKKGVKLEVF